MSCQLTNRTTHKTQSSHKKLTFPPLSLPITQDVPDQRTASTGARLARAVFLGTAPAGPAIRALQVTDYSVGLGEAAGGGAVVLQVAV